MNMPLVLLNRRRRGGAFSPTRLFALAEPGVWYDPSDLTTLFTDTAGTTPVTTPGQTVAVALDKSKGLVLGSELVTNGGPFTVTTGWTAQNSATLSVTNSRLRVAGNGSVGFPFAVASSTTVVGVRYQVSAKAFFVSGSNNNVYMEKADTITGLSNNVSTTPGPEGTISFSFTATATTSYIRLVSIDSNDIYEWDNISVRELPGFHATQATAASRPTYGIVPATGRRNLLTRTEEFGDVWFNASGTVNVTANTTTAPNSTLTADKLVPVAATSYFAKRQSFTSVAGSSYSFSVYAKESDAGVRLELVSYNSGVTAQAIFNLATGAVVATGAGTTTSVGAADANGWRRYEIRWTATLSATGLSDVKLTESATFGANMTGDGSKGILIWGAQLETGSTATAYQRVGSAFDVTEAGVPSLSYLSFDGVDDFMVTPTITPGIDKAQVFAGVRKQSDAARGMLVELGPPAATGTFRLEAPSAASPNYFFLSTGTASAGAGPVVTYAAPISNVLSGLSDISGDLATLRVNGTQVAQSTADQGTGNYSNAIVYIGRRGGTSLPFNGQLYSLIARFGTNLDAGTITSTETWVNQRTGAF